MIIVGLQLVQVTVPIPGVSTMPCTRCGAETVVSPSSAPKLAGGAVLVCTSCHTGFVAPPDAAGREDLSRAIGREVSWAEVQARTHAFRASRT
jgi:hypothetical protein